MGLDLPPHERFVKFVGNAHRRRFRAQLLPPSSRGGGDRGASAGDHRAHRRRHVDRVCDRLAARRAGRGQRGTLIDKLATTVLARRRIDPGLLARHHADPAVCRAARDACRSQAASTSSTRCRGSPAVILVDTLVQGRFECLPRRALAHCLAGADARGRHVGAADAGDAGVDDRRAAAGLRRLRPRQGSRPAPRSARPRLQERDDPDRHRCRARDRLPARWQHHRRDRVRMAGPRPRDRRGRLFARLSAGAGRRARHRGDLCRRELRRRRHLHAAQPEGEAL